MKSFCLAAAVICSLVLKAEAQTVSPIGIQISNNIDGGSVGNVLLEIKNNTSSEYLIPIQSLLDGNIMLSVEDPNAKKGLVTSVLFFSSKISSSPLEPFGGQSVELPKGDVKLEPNSGVTFKLDVSKQLDRARKRVPGTGIDMRVDFTGSFANIDGLKGIVGLKVRSNNLAFEALAPAAN